MAKSVNRSLKNKREPTRKPSDSVAAFVLAGGASTRMGRDKALLELDGVPMLLRMTRLAEPHVASFAAVGPPERYASLALDVVPDHWPGTGPLGGIATALRVSSSEWNLVLGCDLPYLTEEWINWLIARARESSAQAVVPEWQRGIEPLAAMYRKDCEPAFSAALGRGVRRISQALQDIVLERVTASHWHWIECADNLFQNVNRPEDFAEAQRRIARSA
jgi:molybdopterin-guanine dinucleotide biosynthesis protein A